MSNHMAFWRSTGLEQSIRKNAVAARRGADKRHLACSEHSSDELAAFQRSLVRPAATAWQPLHATRH